MKQADIDALYEFLRGDIFDSLTPEQQDIVLTVKRGRDEYNAAIDKANWYFDSWDECHPNTRRSITRKIEEASSFMETAEETMVLFCGDLWRQP